jgi:hypothetical protein
MKRQILASAIAALAMCLCSIAPARATLLSTLLNEGGSIQVGDKLFNGFTYSWTGDMPDPSTVNVLAYVDAAGDFGLQFQGAFLDFLGGSGSDALLGFHVSVIEPNFVITGATLTGNPTVLGGNGIMSITETFLPGNPFASMSIYSIAPGTSKLTDSVTFPQGYQSLYVQKDIMAFSTATNGGVPTLSFFTQTFQQSPTINIPEPASAVLLGIGLMGLAWLRIRRSHGAA